MWKFIFRIPLGETFTQNWVDYSHHNNFKALKKSLKNGLPAAEFYSLDFVPKGGSIEDGDFFILDNLSKIGEVTIKRT